jgi:hypothetical protein
VPKIPIYGESSLVYCAGLLRTKAAFLNETEPREWYCSDTSLGLLKKLRSFAAGITFVNGVARDRALFVKQ